LAIPAKHNIENALAASALARAHGVEPRHIRDGLRAWQPAAHRIATVATVNGVTYIDDSKATNTHAAQTSLLAYSNVVWIAGGMAKGQDFHGLVAACGSRLRGAVLLGVDRALIGEALAAQAPLVPVREVAGTAKEAMVDVVRQATKLAQPGDTVLLAPGCASWDMFRDYAERGDAFAAAVRELAGH
jgi:UDP-N-acetylmuramoylalanine--D-glutamate ligase